ncbi:hypothetical protein DFP98_13530 [Cohnella phaseoli]|uniref:Uncharacterized protein n=1 Tax=Cohnella phaseoli TaxID=456490 RepID=A0A3D9I8G3_9BACL|nr:hypothetical protein DFP98_13530 [Cohnella phaseoli]
MFHLLKYLTFFIVLFFSIYFIYDTNFIKPFVHSLLIFIVFFLMDSLGKKKK